MQINRRFIVLVMGIVILSILFGGLLGDLSVPKYVAPDIVSETTLSEETGDVIQLRHDTRIHVSIAPGSHIPSVLKELQLAVESNVYSFVLSTPLSMSEADQTALLKTLKRIQKMDEDVTVLLALNCTPPASWLREHPDETSTTKKNGMAYPSIGSNAWSVWAQDQLSTLLGTLEPFVEEEFLTGVVLGALENGHWTREESYDQSPAHTLAFQGWLAETYGDITSLQQPWGSEIITEWSGAVVPQPIVSDATSSVLFSDAHETIYSDYHRFLSEATVSTINNLARTVKETTSESFRVEVSYGNSLEYAHAASGNWGVDRLDFTVIDGLTTFPLSHERGMGQHAFFAASPYAGIEWVSIDPIYTGIQYQKSSDSIEVPGTYQPKQIDNLMARNAGLASLYNMAWAWSDPRGQGTLAHPPLWSHLRDTLSLRKTLSEMNDAASSMPNIVIVVDETSMAYVRDNAFVGTLFASIENSISRAGVSVRWTTLHEFLTSEFALRAPVYLFPNLFHVTDEGREAIHAKLSSVSESTSEEGGNEISEVTAVWLYAPGYLGDGAQVEQVAALTGIDTELRKTGSNGGSTFSFSGNWINEEQAFGLERSLNVSFKAVDDEVDPLALYADDQSVSVAMKYLESGWISIAHYEPTLTPEFLHDLLYLLEVPVRLPEMTLDTPMVVYTNSEYAVVHGQGESALSLYFDTAYDINNIVDSEQGWSHTRSIVLNMTMGETAILEFKE